MLVRFAAAARVTAALVAAAFVAATLCLPVAGQARETAFGQAPPRAGSAAVRLADMNDGDGDGEPLTARERQKRCAAQWRGFSAAEQAAQGPKWPQFYNRCIKRLKALKS